MTKAQIKSSLLTLFVVAFLVAIVSAGGWVVISLFKYFSTVSKEIGVALIAGFVTVFVATLTHALGRYFERKKELDALYRDKKTEIYDEFLNRFFRLFWSASESGQRKPPESEDRDLADFLREFTRKLLLWSGPEVIAAFMAWKDHLSLGRPDAQSVFLTEDFLAAIRKDLRHSNSGLQKGFFARLFLAEGPLFLSLAKKNPKITLDEVSAYELRQREKSISS